MIPLRSLKYIFITFGFCLVLNLKAQESHILDRLYPADSLKITYHNAWTLKEYPRRIQQFKKDPLKPNEIVFLGNSLTQLGRNWSQKFQTTGIRNRGIAGDVTDGILARLNEINYFKPKAVFLLIGINDLFNLHKKEGIPSAKYVGKNIVNIAEHIKKESPSTIIYVQTLLPTKHEFLKNYIVEVNAILQENKQHYTFIDLHSQFVNNTGFIKDELTNDGTHLTPEGYTRWVSFLSPIIKKLKANE
ncbi:GDSL-type esterase/lipase family protein [Formosa sp. S-31]|uniref:GDSL-type esterase/lipase family protein n=1 Tax=Formosa sp. S-31 TaxID=2790949 RepID=UPI003EBFB2EE